MGKKTNTTKILLIFDAELPWKWYIDSQASLAKDLKSHVCIHNATQCECSSTVTVTTVFVLTLRGLDVGAGSMMKKKNPVMVHLIFRNPFHNESMLKFLLSFFPLLSSKCPVYPRNKNQSFHITMAVYFAFSSAIILSFCYHSLILPQFQQVPCLMFEKISLHWRTKMHLDFVARPNTFTQKAREASVCSTKIFWLLSEVSENNIKVPWEYGRVPKTEGAAEAISIYHFRLSSFSICARKLSIVSACPNPWP